MAAEEGRGGFWSTDDGGWHPQGEQRAKGEGGGGEGGAERIVPWGGLGLEGLLRACCVRWWATSAGVGGRGESQNTGGPAVQKGSQGKGHQEARERKQGRTRRKDGGRERYVGKREIKHQSKDMGGQKERKKQGKQRHRHSKLRAWSGKGDGWCTVIGSFVWKNERNWRRWNSQNECQVKQDWCASMSPLAVSQAPRLQRSRGGRQSCHKESTAVTLRCTSGLTVANCPTRDCTIRRFCWDDQQGSDTVSDRTLQVRYPPLTPE